MVSLERLGLVLPEVDLLFAELDVPAVRLPPEERFRFLQGAPPSTLSYVESRSNPAFSSVRVQSFKRVTQAKPCGERSNGE